MYFLYSLLLALAVALSAPWWLFAMWRHGKHRSGLSERLGFLPSRLARSEPASGHRAIWIHAVSVGEVLGIAGLLAELKERFPNHRLVVSTTTDTGQKLARERFGAENVFYFPADFAFAIRPYLRALRPELIVIAETEFWPNFLRCAHNAGARIAIVNARISDRSFPRYRRFRFLLQRVLCRVDMFLAQTQEDVRRLVAIGAPAGRVRICGNLKFDGATPQAFEFVSQLKRRLTEAFPILVCGSTVEGEEALLLEMFRAVLRQYPSALMILAPRRPERFHEVTQLLAASGPEYWCRSNLDSGAVLRGGVLLLDTIGELAAIYAVATIAFVGGSLAPRGGHNILEPAHFGLPIVVGQHMENFRDIQAIFQAQDAVRVVREEELASTILALLADQPGREAMGQRARATLQIHTGATARTVDALQTLVGATHTTVEILAGKATP
jgi:3-deoxy-D-manno-octulosonic-acid transferase